MAGGDLSRFGDVVEQFALAGESVTKLHPDSLILLTALSGLAATMFSEYRKLRQEIGLTRYAEEDIETLFAAHFYRAERSSTNIGHNQSRMMFVGRPL